MSFLQNKFVVVILGSVVAAVAGWYLFLRTPAPTPLLATNNLLEANSEAERGVVETLLQLRAITLSGTILSDPAFLSLRDIGTQIVPEPVGRANPFVSIGVSRATTTATSSQPAPRRAQ